MNDQKNTIIAIVLSAIVLIAWEYFYALPQKQRQDALARLQTQSQQLQPVPTAPAATGTPGLPGPAPQSTPPAAERKSREAALAATPRIAIDTPRIKGSISLKGGRVDDVSLAQYHETVDPDSPAIVLLSPSGSPDPFYAEFGWVGAAGVNTPLPGADTL